MAATQKVIYWIAGKAPDTNEAADIATLDAGTVPKYQVAVRSYEAAASVGYGSGGVSSPPTGPTAGNLEACDLCAAHVNANIPAAYSGVPTLVVPPPGSIAGASLHISPSPLSFLHTSVSQLGAVLVDDQGTVTDVTADAGMVWTSGTTATATIGAGTGKLTGVAAGATTITATLTKSGAVMTATDVVTCT